MHRHWVLIVVFAVILLSFGVGFIRNSRSRFLSKTVNKFSVDSLRASTKVDAPAGTTVVEHPVFDVVENTKINEYGVQAILYEHKKSGAQVMSVIAPDETRSSASLFARPEDSTGVPHILEHSVLCSKKYPVKEPLSTC